MDIHVKDNIHESYRLMVIAKGLEQTIVVLNCSLFNGSICSTFQ